MGPDDHLSRLFKDFYEKTFKAVFRFFYYRSEYIDTNTAADLAQESYLRFWNKYKDKLQDFQESQKLIWGICKNVYKEWLKNNVKDAVGFWGNLDDWERLWTQDQISSVDYWDDDDYSKKLEYLRKVLKKLIDKLPNRLKEVINLRYYLGLSRREVAWRLGMKEDHVHTYQKRAIKLLKNYLNRLNESEDLRDNNNKRDDRIKTF